MSEPQSGRGALAAGGLAAILASTCCLGPLVLAALVGTGVWYSGRAARSRPGMLGKSTIEAVVEHIDMRGGHIERP